MMSYRGTQQARMGFYWNRARWEIVTIPKGGGTLPGGDDVRYIRFPLPLVILLGPLVGLAYVVFLPLIGFALFFGFVARKLLAAARKAVGSRLMEAEATTRKEQ